MLKMDAIRELEEAVRRDPQFALAHLQLFEDYRSLGDAGRALRSLNAAERLQQHLPHIQQLSLAAWRARLAGDMEGVISARQDILRRAPRDSGNRFLLADALGNTERYQEAVAVMREGIALDPKDLFLVGQLPYYEFWAGNESAAMQACDRYQRMAGENEPDPWSTRGDLLYAFGHTEEAAAVSEGS